MRISDDVRKYAVEHGETAEEAIAAGMEEKAREFRDSGGEIYIREVADP